MKLIIFKRNIILGWANSKCFLPLFSCASFALYFNPCKTSSGAETYSGSGRTTTIGGCRQYLGSCKSPWGKSFLIIESIKGKKLCMHIYVGSLQLETHGKDPMKLSAQPRNIMVTIIEKYNGDHKYCLQSYLSCLWMNFENCKGYMTCPELLNMIVEVYNTGVDPGHMDQKSSGQDT